jgi:hypothetical protein
LSEPLPGGKIAGGADNAMRRRCTPMTVIIKRSGCEDIRPGDRREKLRATYAALSAPNTNRPDKPQHSDMKTRPISTAPSSRWQSRCAQCRQTLRKKSARLNRLKRTAYSDALRCSETGLRPDQRRRSKLASGLAGRTFPARPGGFLIRPCKIALTSSGIKNA